jgi:hypothetical protein
MRCLKSSGHHVRKHADIITEAMEDKLWELGILGDDNGRRLLDTVFYYIGLYFALRGGEEQRNLRYSPCQITVVESCTERPYIAYEKDTSKTNQGGLLYRDHATKKVIHYEDTACPECCLIHVLKKYNSNCPSDQPPSAFYLKTLKYPKGEVWYQRAAVGHNHLSRTINRLMSMSGISGNFSNHSCVLRQLLSCFMLVLMNS